MSLGVFSGWIDDFPSFDLEEAHALVRENFPSDWKEFWGIGAEHAPEHLDPDDWEEFQRLYFLAQRLGEAAAALVRPPRLADQLLARPNELEREARAHRRLLDDAIGKLENTLPPERFKELKWWLLRPSERGPEARQTVFRTSMQLVATKQFACSPGRMAERLVALLEYLSRVSSLRAQQYLGRVAECYVREMRAEFAVMARAVVQAALEDVLPPEKARGILDMGVADRVGLSALLNAARIDEVVDHQTEEAARRIKNAGDDAAHEFPQLAPDPEQLLSDLVAVLEHLHGHNAS